MKAQTVRLTGPRQRAFAHQQIDQAPEDWVMKLGAETRRDAQNRLLWKLIAIIQEQVPETHGFSAEDMKLRFMNCLGTELRFLPELEGQGMFPVGLRSSTLTVQQFSALIELIYAWGARQGVIWPMPKDELECAA